MKVEGDGDEMLRDDINHDDEDDVGLHQGSNNDERCKETEGINAEDTRPLCPWISKSCTFLMSISRSFL